MHGQPDWRIWGTGMSLGGKMARRVYEKAHTCPFNGPMSGTTRVSRYQKGKTNLDFAKARDSEWQWHQLGHMKVCTSLQTDNHASTPPLSFLQAGCPSCRPTNSVEALKANLQEGMVEIKCLRFPSKEANEELLWILRRSLFHIEYAS